MLHLIYCDKYISLCFEFWDDRIENLRDLCPVPMTVMQNDHSAGDGLIERLLYCPLYGLHPVRRDVVPYNHAVPPLREHGQCFARECTVGWTNISYRFGRDATNISDLIAHMFELRAQVFMILQWKRHMPISVDADVMSVLVDVLDDLRMALDVLSEQKERGVDVVSL